MLLSLNLNPPIWHAMFVLYALLGVASFYVGVFKKPSQASQLKRQINSWWLIFPLISLAILFFPIGIICLAVLIALLIARELSAYFEGKLSLWLGINTFLWMAILALVYFYPQLLLVFLTSLFILQMLYFLNAKTTNSLLILLLFGATLGIIFIVLMTHKSNADKWLFYLFTVTALNDIGQFISGKWLGQHKIAPLISPNKTWQGFAGGMVVSCFVSILLGSYFELAHPSSLLLLGFLLCVSGLAGDLLFSWAKRFLKIKDFSTLIPGHGGILDRVDSLVLTAPLLYFYLNIF